MRITIITNSKVTIPYFRMQFIHSSKRRWWMCLAMLMAVNIATAQYWNPNHVIGVFTGNDHFSYNQTPDQLIAIQPAAVPNENGCTYQWQQSASPVFNTYSNAAGSSTGASYTFTGPLTQTTYFRRVTTNASLGAPLYSNIIKINVVSVNWEDLNYVREHEINTTGISGWTGVDQLPIGQKLQTTSYMDGLGRLVEKISTGTVTPATGSTTWGDMVQFSVYDPYGREPRQYLPYTTTDNPGKYKINATTAQAQYYTNMYNETAAYTNITFDNSPLNRVVNVKDAGTSWAASPGRSSAYDMNGTADNVQLFSADYVPGHQPLWLGAYPPNTLFKETHTDENGKLQVVYTNKSGQTVLTKTQADNTPSAAHSGWICIYTVYDDFGFVRFKLQPEAVKYLDANNWSFSGPNGTQVLNELCFQYYYDEQGRNIWKKAPGAQPLQMLYDVRDRLVFMQDGNQAALGTPQWTTTLYDALDRPVERLLYNTPQTVQGLQSDINQANTTSTITVNNASKPIVDLVVDNRDPAVAVYKAQNSIVFSADAGGSFVSADGDSFTTEIDPSAATPASSGTVTIINNPISSANLQNSAICTPVEYLFYDDYSFAGAQPFTTNFDNNSAYSSSDPNVIPITPSKRTTSLPTGNMVKVLGTANFLVSTYYYDEKERQVQTTRENILQGKDVVTLQYHFDGRLLSTSSRHYTGATGYAGFGILTKNVYDKIGRITSLQKQVGDNPIKTIASYEYDDMGRLKVKHLDPGYTGSGKSEMESLAYSYNIHSHLTGINKEYALKTGGVYSKWGNFFGMYLGYDNKDNVFAAQQLDGHVTGILWSTQGDDVQRKYDYTYDVSGRLSAANFVEKPNPGDGWSNAKMDFSITNLSYDNNGNLLSMLQKGVVPGSATPVTLDNLVYTYAAYSNKLLKVTDNTPQTTTNGLSGDFKDGANGSANDYVYDNNGNVVADLNKNITDMGNVAGANGIVYNFLDKPEQITIKGKGTIQIVYDAEGNRLQKIFTPQGGIATITTYINQYVYTGNNLQYINFEEGRIRVVQPVSQNNGFDALAISGNLALPNNTQGAYDFFIRDYQQNIRMILTEEVHTGSNTCTMETGRQAAEDALFQGSGNEVENTRVAITTIPGQTTGGGWHSNTTSSVSKLGNYSGGFTIGPNVLLKVMAGDVVNATTQYYYQAPVTNTAGSTALTQNVLSTLVTAIGQSPSTPALVKSSITGVQTALTGDPLFAAQTEPDANNASGTNPKAYLTVLFFDERFNFVGTSGGSNRVVQAGDNAGPLVLANMQAPKNGYAYVYLSNESAQPVYFDNMQVGLNHGRIIEEDHYYAYGLKIAAISSSTIANIQEGHVDNKNLYNDKELDDDLGLNWYDYGFRNYDAQIGRFMQLDPLTDSYTELTPYQYASCDPIENIDLDGLEGFSATVLESIVSTATKFAADIPSASAPLIVTAYIHSAKQVSTAWKMLSVSGSFLKGIGQSLWGTVTGVAQVIRHPIQTAGGIISMVVHPVQTFKAIKTGVKNAYKAFRDGDANTRANMLGKLTGEVGQMLIGAGEAKAGIKVAEAATEATEISKVTKAARGAEAVEEAEEAAKLQKFKEVKPPCGCFAAGTLVLTNEGYKPIELIQTGDIVLAYNDTTQTYASKKVVKVFEHVRDTIFQLHLAGEVIQTTSDHPFFIGGRWLQVQQLHTGDSLASYTGKKFPIDAITRLVKPTTVHNFEVADFHTYYVSAQQVLVHNNVPCPNGTGAAKGGGSYLYHYTSKEAAEAISQQGLKVGRDGFSYLTNKGGLSPLQAQIELALPANRALPNSILRIDASGLNPALIRRVSGNLPGYGAGGGTEFLFNQHIPANLIKVIK